MEKTAWRQSECGPVCDQLTTGIAATVFLFLMNLHLLPVYGRLNMLVPAARASAPFTCMPALLTHAHSPRSAPAVHFVMYERNEP